MSPVVIMGPPLVAGLLAALLAERRGWAPPLWVAIGVGAVLRLVVMFAASADPIQQYDFDVDFRGAADAVLNGLNPTMHMREGGWHFLPFLAYVLAGQRELGGLLGVPWSVMGRLVPVLADIAIIPLVARLASERGRLRALQYACVPLGVMVSAIHGQLPPLTLLFGVAALVAARQGRVQWAGLLVGLSVTCSNWSVLLVPGVVLAVSGARRRWAVLAWSAGVPAAFLLSSVLFLDTPLTGLVDLARTIMSTRPVVGDWGWTALVTGGGETVSPLLGRIGTPVLIVGLLAAGWWWRRSDPIDLTLVLLLAFLILTYRLGAQYLMWPAAYLLARPSRWSWVAIILTSAWAAAGYLRVYEVLGVTWSQQHHWTALLSIVVIAFMIRALPARPGAPDVSPPATPVAASA